VNKQNQLPPPLLPMLQMPLPCNSCNTTGKFISRYPHFHMGYACRGIGPMVQGQTSSTTGNSDVTRGSRKDKSQILTNEPELLQIIKCNAASRDHYKNFPLQPFNLLVANSMQKTLTCRSLPTV